MKDSQEYILFKTIELRYSTCIKDMENTKLVLVSHTYLDTASL